MLKMTASKIRQKGFKPKRCSPSLERDLDVPIRNLLLQILWIFPIYGAPNRHARAEDLLDGPTKILRHGSGTHNPRDLNHVVKRDVARVFDVLHLLSVTLRLLEGLDDESSGRRDDRDLGLTILDGELDGDAKTFPVLRGLLGDILTDLLGGETEGTDLWGKGTGGADLTAGDANVNVDDLGGVEFGRHCACLEKETAAAAAAEKKIRVWVEEE